MTDQFCIQILKMLGCYWCLAPLMLASYSASVESSVFFQKNEATRVLKVQKRSNWLWEEFKPGSLERECYEELCSFEEAGEIYKSREKTTEFWFAYKNLNPCQSNPCLNGGLCKLDSYLFICLCPPLWKGANCEIENLDCEYKNGYCQQYCSISRTTQMPTCSCGEGYRLNEDQQTCSVSEQYPCGRMPLYGLQTRGIDEEEYSLNDTDTDYDYLTKLNYSEPEAQTRIVGGTICRRGLCPWQVLIHSRDGYGFCGGTLINSHWVISAAHCFDTIRPHSITAGEFDTLRTEVWDQKVLVKKFLTHPQYNAVTYDNDIALLYLNQSVNFTFAVAPICLPNPNLGQLLLQNGKVGMVSGWGVTQEKGRASRFLRRVQLPYVDQTPCVESTKLTITDNMFCAGYTDEYKDSCKGDSGGPYAVLYRETWYLLGVISWGEGCGKRERYGIYTRVPGYLSWIHNSLLFND
ncbi:coagulation factor IX isoform X2 [Rhinoraja longicauda]